MYPRTRLVSFCQVGITVLVLFSYPLQLHPARASLDKFLFPVKPSEGDEPASDHGSGDEIPLGRFVIESGVLLFSTFVIAMFVSSLEVVLGFVGATGSTTISFILPAVFCASLVSRLSSFFVFPPCACLCSPSRVLCTVLSLFKGSTDPRDQRLRYLATLLLVWGVLVMVVSLSLNIYHLVHQPEQNSLHTLGYLGGNLHAPAAAAVMGDTLVEGVVQA